MARRICRAPDGERPAHLHMLACPCCLQIHSFHHIEHMRHSAADTRRNVIRIFPHFRRIDLSQCRHDHIRKIITHHAQIKLASCNSFCAIFNSHHKSLRKKMDNKKTALPRECSPCHHYRSSAYTELHFPTLVLSRSGVRVRVPPSQPSS